jgi:hypothetical protein
VIFHMNSTGHGSRLYIFASLGRDVYNGVKKLPEVRDNLGQPIEITNTQVHYIAEQNYLFISKKIAVSANFNRSP